MKKQTLCAAFAAVFASWLAAPAWAQEDEKVKALEKETAQFAAQAARDAAEAGAIRAAAELAKARNTAADADAAALNAKTAKDQAETAALAAAKALADAKAGAANQDSTSEQALLNSSAALTAAKVNAQVAEITALKAAFGEAPKLGSDGNVTISDSTGGMLLESKSGSLKTTAVMAQKLCSVLSTRGIQGAIIAPPELEKKIVASRFMLREFDALVAFVNDPANKSRLGAGVAPQIAPGAFLSAITLLQYGAGAVQTIAKLFRSDYTISLADAHRDTWLQYFMAASCPQQLALVDVEAKVRSLGFETEIGQLNDLAKFADAATSRKAIQARKLEEAKATIKQKEEKNVPLTQGDTDKRNDAQQQLDELSALDAGVVRIKALIELVATKPDTFMDAVVWSRFGTLFADRPRITLAYTTQDGQVIKSHWLLGKHVYGRSSGELVYRVVNAKGGIDLAGYLTATNSDGEIKFSQGMEPAPRGLEFPSQPPR